MTIDLALIAEASRTVGTGHLIESLEIARQLHAGGCEVLVVVTPEAPAPLVARAPVPVKTITDLEPETLAETAQWLADGGARLVLTNLRQISNVQVQALRRDALRVWCIDEGGGRRLDCDGVIYPILTPLAHPYISCQVGFTVHAGADYLALAPAYARWHDQPRTYRPTIQSLVIAMGGIDRTGATRHIVRALETWDPDVERHVVLGAGCPWEEELKSLVADASARWFVHRNLPSLADALAGADVGISAGGNTLYELACVGTPALVLYEDPHEAGQGRAFEARGFGRCLGPGTAVTDAALRQALDGLHDPVLRQAQGEAGRRLVDGRGVVRIGRILAEQLFHDSSVTARAEAV